MVPISYIFISVKQNEKSYLQIQGAIRIQIQSENGQASAFSCLSNAYFHSDGRLISPTTEFLVRLQ